MSSIRRIILLGLLLAMFAISVQAVTVDTFNDNDNSLSFPFDTNFDEYQYYITVPNEQVISARMQIQPLDIQGQQLLPADVMIVTDVSGSMNDDCDSISPTDFANSGESPCRINDAITAISSFMDNVNFDAIRVGFVSYSTCPDPNTNVISLTDDRSNLDPALPDYVDEVNDLGGWTNIDTGLRLAYNELEANDRGAPKYIILLTDGIANRHDPDDNPSTLNCVNSGSEFNARVNTVQTASVIKGNGTQIFGVAFGSGADQQTTQAVASSQAHSYFAPTAQDLLDIYNQIAQTISTQDFPTPIFSVQSPIAQSNVWFTQTQFSANAIWNGPSCGHTAPTCLDFAQLIQDNLDACGLDNCDIAFNLESDTVGQVDISDLEIVLNDAPFVSPFCGDGNIDPGEVCDGNNLGDVDECVDLGFSSGPVSCNDDCTFDTSECTPNPQCGDGICSAGEVCTIDCEPICGDGVCEPGEDCPADCNSQCGDGVCDPDETCPIDCGDPGCGDGICSPEEICPIDCEDPICGDGVCDPGEICTIDCGAICGNAILEPGEECEPGDTLTCAELGFPGGISSCVNCQIDTSQCEPNDPPTSSGQCLEQQIVCPDASYSLDLNSGELVDDANDNNEDLTWVLDGFTDTSSETAFFNHNNDFDSTRSFNVDTIAGHEGEDFSRRYDFTVTDTFGSSVQACLEVVHVGCTEPTLQVLDDSISFDYGSFPGFVYDLEDMLSSQTIVNPICPLDEIEWVISEYDSFDIVQDAVNDHIITIVPSAGWTVPTSKVAKVLAKCPTLESEAELSIEYTAGGAPNGALSCDAILQKYILNEPITISVDNMFVSSGNPGNIDEVLINPTTHVAASYDQSSNSLTVSDISLGQETVQIQARTDLGVFSNYCDFYFTNLNLVCDDSDCDCVGGPDPVEVCLIENDCGPVIQVANPFVTVVPTNFYPSPIANFDVNWQVWPSPGYSIDPTSGFYTDSYNIEGVSMPHDSLDPSGAAIMTMTFEGFVPGYNQGKMCPLLKHTDEDVGDIITNPSNDPTGSGDHPENPFFEYNGNIYGTGPYIFIAQVWLRR